MRIRLAVTTALLAPIILAPFAGGSIAAGAATATTAVTPYGTIWTVDGSANSISAYPPDASGVAAPVVAIAGPDTGLDSPSGVALSPTGDVYVANEGNNSITEYAAAATGDATPIATIAGSETGLDGPKSISFAYGEVWVANPDANLITSFAAGSTGNELPAETLGGDKTKINHPTAVDVDPIFGSVAILDTPVSGPDRLLTFVTGKRGNTKPDGVDRADRSLPFGNLDAVTQTGGDRYWVADATHNAVTPINFDPGAQGVSFYPPIHGKHTGLDAPDAIGIDGRGRIVVANAGSQTIEVFGTNAKGNATPLRTITGTGDVTALRVVAARPSAPTHVTVAMHRRRATIAWQPPSNNGGGILGYEVDVNRHGHDSFFPYNIDFLPLSLFLTTRHTSVTRHLHPGVRYDVTVAAINDYGERAARTVPAVDVVAPSRPRQVHATANGAHAVTVHWKAPRADGGATLRRYTIQYAAGCMPESKGCATTSIQVNGFQTSERIGSLQAATSYLARMVAHNKAGASGPSRVRTVTTSG